MKTPEKEWGVVQSLKIEADTKTTLTSAVQIALTEHSEVTHWAEVDGALLFYWGEETESNRLIVPMKDPEKVADLADAWLKDGAEYPTERPDTDGSTKRGYLFESGYSYIVCKITPIWIVYGK